MKTLFLYCNRFAFTPTTKTLDFAPDNTAQREFENVQTVFIHAEAEDAENESSIFKKLVKQIKWITKKNNTRQLVIHSFAHLSENKAEPEFTMQFLNKLEERMKNSGFETAQTPFGYFLDLHMDAPGFSLARVYKSF